MADADPATKPADARAEDDADAIKAARQATRKRWLTRLAIVVGGAALIWGVWYLLIGRNHIGTDNAYVNAEVAQVSPLANGQVVEVMVSDTQTVKAGDLLLDYSKCAVSARTMKLLASLAKAADVEAKRDAMFAARPPDLIQPSSYSALRNSKTVIVTRDDFDVFGDGTVVIKLAPGHTPGHQVLYVKLAKTGGVLLSGDLYHYPEERTLGRVPTFEFNKDQTVAARAVVETFLKNSGAELWIQHDFAATAKLRKAPQYYD